MAMTFRLEMVGGPLDGCWLTITVEHLEVGNTFVADIGDLGYPAYVVSEWRGNRRWVVVFSAEHSGDRAEYRQTKGVEQIEGYLS